MKSKHWLIMIAVYTALMLFNIWLAFTGGSTAFSLVSAAIVGVAIGFCVAGYRMAKRRERIFEQQQAELQQWIDNSPFSQDVIREGDPGWAIFQAALHSSGGVYGDLDPVTGEVLSITEVDKDGNEKVIKARKESDDGNDA